MVALVDVLAGRRLAPSQRAVIAKVGKLEAHAILAFNQRKPQLVDDGTITVSRAAKDLRVAGSWRVSPLAADKLERAYATKQCGSDGEIVNTILPGLLRALPTPKTKGLWDGVQHNVGAPLVVLCRSWPHLLADLIEGVKKEPRVAKSKVCVRLTGDRLAVETTLPISAFFRHERRQPWRRLSPQ